MNFANFLQNSEFELTMDENKISTHIETGDIFFENENTQKSICSNKN